jgi:hypothetical protein
MGSRRPIVSRRLLGFANFPRQADKSRPPRWSHGDYNYQRSSEGGDAIHQRARWNRCHI